MTTQTIVVKHPSNGILIDVSQAGVKIRIVGGGPEQSVTIPHADIAAVATAIVGASNELRGFKNISETARSELRKIAAILGVESRF